MAKIQSTYKPKIRESNISEEKKIAIKEAYSCFAEACRIADLKAIKLAEQTREHMFDRYIN